MGLRFRIDIGAYIFLALGLLILPLDWLLGAVLAASFHELCHWAAAKALGIRCFGIHIGTGGIQMVLAPMGRREACIIASAGPLGSFLLLGFLRVFPKMSVCACVQGMFNLLPIRPLDGGRILESLLRGREKLISAAELTAAIVLLCTGLYLSRHWGWSPLILAVIVTVKAFLRKIPCKDALLGVQ